MQPVAVARNMKVTEYCSSPQEPMRQEAAFASFQTVYILEQKHSLLVKKQQHTKSVIALHAANFLTPVDPLWFLPYS